MSLAIEYFFLFCAVFCLLLGCATCLQEDLRKLFFYSMIGHAGYFFLFLAQAVGPGATYEAVSALLFYVCFISFSSGSFFFFVGRMKRSGNTYPIRSIYDFAQLWLIDKVLASCCLIFLMGLASIPFFPGFLCRWFFVQCAFHIHPVLGLVSFFTCLCSSYPYLRIMHQILLNQNLMLNEKGPRWYFDQLLSAHYRRLFFVCTLFFIFFSFRSSVIWYLCQFIT